jgi:phosphoglycolate phosphatase
VHYQLIMFDFDGTLADSLPWFMGAMNRAADRFGFRHIDAAEAELLRTLGPREILAKVGLPFWKVPAVASWMRRQMNEERDQIRLFPGAAALLQGLREAGAQTAILTSNSMDNVRHVLGPATVAHVTFFECGASLLGKSARFARVLRMSGVAPQRALYIGDELRDAEAAASAGIDFRGVAWGYTTPAALARVTQQPLLERLDELTPQMLTG